MALSRSTAPSSSFQPPQPDQIITSTIAGPSNPSPPSPAPTTKRGKKKKPAASARAGAIPFAPPVGDEIPDGFHMCSQCKQVSPLSAFPTRIATLQPYLVCKSHAWYWTEEKRQTYWAPDKESTVEDVCDGLSDQPDAGWIVAGGQDQRERLVYKITQAGGWSSNQVTIRKSRAKPQPGPPPPIPYIFALKPYPTEPPDPVPLRLHLTYHPAVLKWTVLVKPEGPHIGQGPWKAAKEKKTVRDKPKKRKEEADRRKAEFDKLHAAVKRVDGPLSRVRDRRRKGVAVETYGGDEAEVEVEIESSDESEDEDEDEDEKEDNGEELSPAQASKKRSSDELDGAHDGDGAGHSNGILPSAAESLLALAFGGSPLPSGQNTVDPSQGGNVDSKTQTTHARQLIAALEHTLTFVASEANSPIQVPASSQNRVRSEEDRFTFADHPEPHYPTPPPPRPTTATPPARPPKRARATLVHHGPAPTKPSVWPPPASTFVPAMAGLISTRNGDTARGDGKSMQPLSLAQLLASPFLEPPVIPDRLAPKTPAAADDGDEVDELASDEQGSSDEEGGEYVDSEEDSIIDSEEGEYDDDEDDEAGEEDEEDEEEEDGDEGDWLTGFVKGELKGIAEDGGGLGGDEDQLESGQE